MPVTHSKRPSGGHDLVKEAGYWLRMEEENRELKSRIASALDDIKGFVEKQRADLEKRKARLIQTSGFKDETRGMEAAIANIHQLLTGGRNVSAIFAAIDGFLDTYKADDTFAREHTRMQLADAREDFVRAFHDSVRGTRLAELLDVLYFMPFSCWRSRGVERRNFRSPSAAEVLKLLQDLDHRGVAVNGLEAAHLAAIVRLKLGITPRMDYHLMPSNKLAGHLTSEETLGRVASREVPLDDRFCRTLGGMLAHVRRWSAECFGTPSLPAPPEIEAEMLQILYLSADALRVSGTENERGADYLWLLCTVIAGARSPLAAALAGLSEKDISHPSVRHRIMAAKSYLDEIAVSADRVLLSRWAAAREELDALTALADAIASKRAHGFGEFTELERLKEKRSDAVKSLIKLSDSLLLLEPSIVELLTSASLGAPAPSAAEHLSALDPAKLKDRNRGYAEETRMTARRELENLRLLIARISEIGRNGLSDPAGLQAQERHPGENRARKTVDGADLAELPVADLQARRSDLLRRVAFSVRDFRGKVEGARKRSFKIDLQHALNVFCEKLRNAAEYCDASDLDATDPARAAQASTRIVPLLGEIMAAQTSLSTRVGSARLTPAEKQPLVALLYSVKARLGDDLRDLERIGAELAERSAGVQRGPEEEGGAEVVSTVPEDAPVESGTSEEAALTKLSGFASAANAAMRPVKDLMGRLKLAISSGSGDSQAMLAATLALKEGITEARDQVAWNRLQLDALAADSAVSAGEHIEKLTRWDGQLVALGGETDRLLKVVELVGTLETAVQGAASAEREISDSVRVLSVKEIGADDLARLRGHCVTALQAVAGTFAQLLETQECLAGASAADWRLLKVASAYLERRLADLKGWEAELKVRHSRIGKVHRLLRSAQSRDGCGP